MNTLQRSIIGLALTLPLTTLAEQPNQSEIASLRKEIHAIQKDVSDIKAAVLDIKRNFDEARQKRTPVQPVTLKLDESSLDDFVLGSPTAPVTIMEFYDYQCGFCARFHRAVLPKLERDFISKGQVKIIYRDYVLESHPYAADAASVAACAKQQGKFKEVHEALFLNPELLNDGQFDDILSKVSGLSAKELSQCLEKPEYQIKRQPTGNTPSTEVQADMAEGEKIGVMGTPAFFIFPSAAPGSEVTGFFVRGDQELDIFADLISQTLTGK